MKQRKSSSRQSGKAFFLLTLFLLLAGAFGALFYALYKSRLSYEREKVEHDVDLLNSALQATLLSNEGFFLARTREDADGMLLRQGCQEYIATHPEIVTVAAKTANGTLRWMIAKDSSIDPYPQLSPENTALFSYHEKWRKAYYSSPFLVGQAYYFKANFVISDKESSLGSLTIVYSAEGLLKEILSLHPMQNSEVTLFSGSGQSIASTGYSNAPSAVRIQRAVNGYAQLLSLDVADNKYSFWTEEMIAAALFCSVLCAAVAAMLSILQRDVRKLRSAQSSLNSSEERFRTIFEGSADGIRLMDRYGRIVMVNSAYCDLVKTSSEELLREYNSGNENLEERYASNSAFRSQFDAGTLKMPTSQVIKCREGEEIPVEVNHSFIELGKGEKLLLSVFRDVGEKRRLEMESQQVQKMDALGEFAVGIGNNLKNIFGIVMNSAEMISKEISSDAHVSRYITMIIEQSKRASELADDLLVFARSKETEQKPIIAEKLIRQAQKILQHSLPPSIQVSVGINDNLSVVNGDVHQLHQAIVNLALTAQTRIVGEGTIRIDTSVADPDMLRKRSPALEGKEFLEVKITDSGKELDEYSQRRIFEPYFNARATDQSSGLRLSVTYGIVQRHLGFIVVDSKKGTGTSISLYLPVAYHEKPEEAHAATAEPQGGSECILVVDDEDSFRQLYEYGLQSIGYKVYTAQDGEEAYAVYQEHRAEIDLVVSDLMMPKVNGEELITKLLASNQSLRTILATGAIDLKAKTELLRLGIRDIIMKPFLFDELMLVVRKVLDAR